jgi:hypothetical protein
MNTSNAVAALRKEHEDISQFLVSFESALTLAASGEDEARGLGLEQLREMAAQNARLRETCRQDEEALNSSPFFLGDDAERTLWRQSLFHLERASFEFRKELVFATTLFTRDMVARGRQLLASFREHVACEEELLRRIEEAPLCDPTGLGLKE